MPVRETQKCESLVPKVLTVAPTGPALGALISTATDDVIKRLRDGMPPKKFLEAVDQDSGQ